MGTKADLKDPSFDSSTAEKIGEEIGGCGYIECSAKTTQGMFLCWLLLLMFFLVFICCSSFLFCLVYVFLFCLVWFFCIFILSFIVSLSVSPFLSVFCPPLTYLSSFPSFPQSTRCGRGIPDSTQDWLLSQIRWRKRKGEKGLFLSTKWKKIRQKNIPPPPLPPPSSPSLFCFSFHLLPFFLSFFR